MECLTVEQIDPNKCAGYRNIFVHCGVNDIRQHSSNVEHSFTKLVSKLNDICTVCPYAKITVSPILPTKLPWLNQRARAFNHLLFQYCYSNNRIGSLDFDCFLDENGILAEKHGRFHDKSDAVHLGASGIFTLSRLIANKVLHNTVDGRSYNAVAGSKAGLYNSRLSNVRT